MPYPVKKGGEVNKYEERSKEDLYKQAEKNNIAGWNEMSKDGLIKALGNLRNLSNVTKKGMTLPVKE